MKVDLYLPVGEKHLPTMARQAVAAEALGFAGLWTSETKHDALLPLAIAAEHTHSIQLGTSVAIAFARSPMTMAQAAWDLQDLSAGRFLLGLGTQVKAHIERRFSMPWGRPVARLREYVLALRAIWASFQTNEPLVFRGQFYQHTLLTPFFNPGPIADPAIPISIAGLNRGLAQLAGELCQGFQLHPFHTPFYLREVIRPALAFGAARANRSLQEIELMTSVFVITGASQAERAKEREHIRRQLAFYASTLSYRTVLEAHSWQDVGEQLTQLASQQRWEEMPALISDEILHAVAVEAEPEEVGPAIKERYEGLVDRVSCYMLPFVAGSNEAFWQALLRSLQEQSSEEKHRGQFTV